MKKLMFALVAVASFACGGNPAAQSFEGLWSGNGTVVSTLNSVNGAQTQTSPITGESDNIVQGTTSDIIISWSGCNIPALIKGDVATFAPSYACTQNSGQAQVTLTFTSGVATLNQNTLVMTGAGNISAVQGSQTFSGSFNLQDTLTRVGK